MKALMQGSQGSVGDLSAGVHQDRSDSSAKQLVPAFPPLPAAPQHPELSPTTLQLTSPLSCGISTFPLLQEPPP